ncbi:MAG: hypothetical protein U9P63_02425 [Patescibacteria group bacterium]|nr:hypothetical protein [Patescibacteria group bacterium]
MNFDLFSKNSILSPQDKKQRLMVFILFVIVLIIIIILYFNFWRSPTLPNTEGVNESPIAKGEFFEVDAPDELIEEIDIEKIDFDANFLESSCFKNLKIYGEWPLEVGEKGRANPFLPY